MIREAAIGPLPKTQKPKIQRVREREAEPERLRTGRPMVYSDLCEKIWSAANGSIDSKKDLEEAIRNAKIKVVPDQVPDELVSIAVITGGKFESTRDYILYRGVAHYSTMMRMYRRKLEAVFEKIGFS